MARPKRTKTPPAPAPAPKEAAPSLGEALLLATVCMVGLPVEVQVRDGSAYAGVFHTACVDGGYGVVLKKARKITNGKDDANISLGAFVDTLVVLPDDLVQVIAKDFSLPTKDVCRTPVCDSVAASASVKTQTSSVKDLTKSNTENVSPLKQVKKCNMPGQESDISIGKGTPANCSYTSSVSPTGYVAPHFSCNGISSSSIVGSRDGSVTSSVLTTPTVASNVKISPPVSSATKTVMPSKITAKESKLNPCARVFSPSFVSSRPVLAAAPSVNPSYISNSITGVPTGVPVFETNSVPCGSSLSSKVIHYSNLPPVNYAVPRQYIQPTMVHNVPRLDPARIGTPYHPMQVGPTYISPSSQPGAGGKFNHVVYVHPVSQDVMHGTPVITQAWSHPPSLNTYQTSFQKFQGTTPVYVAPPVMATGNLPLVVPSPAPFVPPFQAASHPIMVPAASSMVPGKYM
ncbi:hypothetical protein GUJ93_ZPchr0004g38488 [Zizania palustris]|uniref:Ataxin 2 SM domain-containing protein n=1 Tax=Zizania palustris TaxID=103762 RepID=A0A8J5T1A2_ZIZPA|nr:hypothetical protein GUJ93_ZPchr0004g38488 [Zizania palustris]